jgi:hypothetical protein
MYKCAFWWQRRRFVQTLLLKKSLTKRDVKATSNRGPIVYKQSPFARVSLIAKPRWPFFGLFGREKIQGWAMAKEATHSFSYEKMKSMLLVRRRSSLSHHLTHWQTPRTARNKEQSSRSCCGRGDTVAPPMLTRRRPRHGAFVVLGSLSVRTSYRSCSHQ